MTIEIKVPTLPESVMDAVVVKLYAQLGDTVERDAPIMDLETDKIVLEVPAPENGILSSINTEVGATVVAGDLLAVLDKQTDQTTTSNTVDNRIGDNVKSALPIASPAAEKIAHENNIDLALLNGSGKNQRITKQDVVSFIGQQQIQADNVSLPAEKDVTQPESPTQRRPVSESDDTDRPQRREPMSRLRQRIAQRLLQAQHESATLTTFNEVNMQSVMKARAHYKEEFEKRYGARLGFMSFFVKACTQALLNYPITNASIDGNDVIYHDYIDIGIAVSSPRGLVVPVLRDVQNLSFGEIEKQILMLAEKAQSNKLSLQDLSGGTFSISNGGVFGSMLSTPLLNPPQSAILGMHNITQRAMVEDGEVVIRPMMYLALSYDHRLIDGRDAVQFLVSIKQDLEDPSRLLLGL